jgi:hypothetical protein
MRSTFEGPQSERMGEEEAHDEANIVRAAAEGTTAEDYDNALSIIEQLRAAAENELGFEKIAKKILRSADKGVIELLHKLDILAAGTFSIGGHVLADTVNNERRYREDLGRLKERFQDAEKKLTDLKDAGRRFGETKESHS